MKEKIKTPITDVSEKGLKSTKNPIVAGLLSLVIPGLGQIYNGQKIKGSFIIIFTISFGVAVNNLNMNLKKSDEDIIYWVVMIPIWIYAIINAYQQAKKIK